MSTRSGKRIHSSFHEVCEKTEPEAPFKSERKTRNKRFKENEGNVEVTHSKLKKRQNYVSYPVEDEPASEPAAYIAPEAKSTRKIKKYTLKEHNTNVPEDEIFSTNVEAKKATRVTRHTKKFENIEDVPISTGNGVALEENEYKKTKKNKKKRSKGSDINDNHTDTTVKNDEETKPVSKKSKKKKKGKRSRTSQEPEVKAALNATNTSIDSFHSAAGSPLVDKIVDKISKTNKLDATFENTSLGEHVPNEIVKVSKKKSKATKSPEKCEVDNAIEEKNHADDVNLNQSDMIEKDTRRSRKSSVKMTGNDDPAESRNSTKLNSTYDRTDGEAKNGNEKLNSTFETEPKVRRSLRLSHIVIENNDDDKASKLSVNKPLNSTFEKSRESSANINLDSTFDKSNPKLNSTFDKNEFKVDSAKSSLITSDEGTVNLTYDKEDNCRISITSDESRTENIVNTTPVLIESSMDESHASISTSKHSDLNVTKDKNTSPTPSSQNTLQIPITPLKREGTFTKETAEVTVGNQTPTKNITLPSPGCTPFHTRSSQKSVLNVTRSIEKRRSSLVEAVQRQTKVMFCSPVNNPLVVNQQKRKVIKSSMKGSNKSFVFEEKEPAVKPAARKRSYTHNDAEDRSSKRKRLGDDLQLSVDRLSRPRTSSASAKLTETPSKRAPTPAKPKSDIKRTKLPNFAALHRKEFAKMESLDECVDRRAKRARQLLTPNGAINVLERSSPRASDQTITKDPVKETKPKETKQSDKPEMSLKLSKLPTLESLRPGYTRFGFKMNCDVNPFSIPSKKEGKTTEKKPPKNGSNAILAPKTPMLPTAAKPLTRQTILPSLNGTTTSRKEAAKQTVLREKSFTLSSKRDVKRTESRTVIKGVRTNRRFELQMQMRNID